ncbi:hypothetical protein [Octadecabacter ascidiaceicola]|nr:hypothetical protein [Octadecabacter ascidiaceicola]
MSAILGITPEKVLRRVGLSASLVGEEEISVRAETYFRIWDAMYAEADRPGVEMELAMAYAHGPFLPPILPFHVLKPFRWAWSDCPISNH